MKEIVISFTEFYNLISLQYLVLLLNHTIMSKKLLFLIVLFCQSILFSQKKDIQLVSWNIRDFGKTKSREELNQIADIVKHTDILAIQEVVAGFGGAQAVAKLTDILNRKGSKWDYVISTPTHSSKFVTERYAFIWKTKHIKIKNRGRLIAEIDATVDREPFLLDFYLGQKKFSILNFHSRPYNKNPQDEVKAISNYVLNSIRSPLVIAGDFNMNEKDNAFKVLRKEGYAPSIFNKKTTLKTSCKNNIYVNHAIDNIYYSKEFSKINSGIIDFVKFCDNLEMARKLSDHLPVYLVFSM